MPVRVIIAALLKSSLGTVGVVGVDVGVLVGVRVAVFVGVLVNVAAGVSGFVGVMLGISVGRGEAVFVGVFVSTMTGVGVRVGVKVKVGGIVVFVDVSVGVTVGLWTVFSTIKPSKQAVSELEGFLKARVWIPAESAGLSQICCGKSVYDPA